MLSRICRQPVIVIVELGPSGKPLAGLFLTLHRLGRLLAAIGILGRLLWQTSSGLYANIRLQGCMQTSAFSGRCMQTTAFSGVCKHQLSAVYAHISFQWCIQTPAFSGVCRRQLSLVGWGGGCKRQLSGPCMQTSTLRGVCKRRLSWVYKDVSFQGSMQTSTFRAVYANVNFQGCM